jgi:hypothetical protein
MNKGGCHFEGTQLKFNIGWYRPAFYASLYDPKSPLGHSSWGDFGFDGNTGFKGTKGYWRPPCLLARGSIRRFGVLSIR